MNLRSARLTRPMVVAALLALAVPGWASTAGIRHSGTVVAVDQTSGALTLDELGPWRVEHGKTVVTKRTVTVTGATEWTRASRAAGAGAQGWLNEFVETSIGPWQVRPGDYATVEMGATAGRGVATKVIVSELDAR
jgi:hypothetical protein